MPKVSVIVPVYNTQDYLRECLESLRVQTLLDVEFVCINDGSTDSSLNILKEFKSRDSRFRVISRENRGYGATINEGIEASLGEYVGILESDDFVAPCAYEKLYGLAKGVDLVKADWFEYSPKKTKKKNRIFKNMKKEELLMAEASVWSAIYKRSFLNENNITCLKTPGASFQDTSFAFKAISLAKTFSSTDEAFIYYRQDNPASSVKDTGKAFAICEEYKEIEAFGRFFNIALLNKYSAYCWNLSRVGNVFLERFYEEFKEHFKKKELQDNFFKRYPEAYLLLLNPSYFAFTRKSPFLTKSAKYGFGLSSSFINMTNFLSK